MVVRFMPSAASFINCLPTRVDPVKETLRITGEARRCVDTCDGTPKTIEITPLGSPASMSARATSSADAGVCSAGFMMHGTSRSQRRAQFAARIAYRKIPRSECCHGTHWLSQHGHPNARRSLRQYAAISPAAFFGVPFQNVRRAVRLKTRFVNGFAFFDGGDARDVFGALVHQIRGALQNLSALLRRHTSPDWISLLGGIQRSIQIGFGCVGQHADTFTGGRIHHRFVLAAVIPASGAVHSPPMRSRRSA